MVLIKITFILFFLFFIKHYSPFAGMVAIGNVEDEPVDMERTVVMVREQAAVDLWLQLLLPEFVMQLAL